MTLRPIRALLVAAVAAGVLSAIPTPALAASVTRPPSAASQAPYGPNDAPVLLVLGQSNAVGAPTISAQADVALCNNMPGVRALRTVPNRVVGATSATWGGYTCSGTNLGAEHNNGLTWNVASAFAMRWQRALNAGQNLPQLNVIHVAWGSQGLQEADGAGVNGWWPGRNPNDVASLYPLTLNTVANGLNALRAAGKTPRIVGLHWNQWETESVAKTVPSVDYVKRLFKQALSPFRALTGDAMFPMYLYRPRTSTLDPTSTQRIIDGFTQLVGEPAPNPFQMIDPADATDANGAPLWNANTPNNYGIFDDGLHYNAAVQQWFADKQWKAIFTDGGRGEPARTLANLAKGRPATQSSTYDANVAARAVDGTVNGVYAAGSVTHTYLDANAWWQVDLGGSAPISTVSINNRTDCCTDRLSNFSVFVSNTDMTGRTFSSLRGDTTIWRHDVTGTAPAQLVIPAPTTGRYVRVQLAGSNFLSLAEVAVNSIGQPTPPTPPASGTNVARGKPATQSSGEGPAWRAVDGNTNGVHTNGSITHTYLEANPWWQVDLGDSVALGSITINNRTDCCADRLSNFSVFVSNTDMTGRTFSSLRGDTTIWRHDVAGTAPAQLVIPAPTTGRYVRVQLAGSNYLSLAEVTVTAR